MNTFSRRDFLLFSAALPLFLPFQANALTSADNRSTMSYPDTVKVLKQAYKSEMIAHKHYVGYVEKARMENYPNIAYMFQAFSISEKIHADNYDRIISNLGDKIINTPLPITVHDTKTNLATAAEKEMEKIEIIYPDFINKAQPEAYDEAITHLMYSWKSHRQHEEKIKKYTGRKVL